MPVRDTGRVYLWVHASPRVHDRRAVVCQLALRVDGQLHACGGSRGRRGVDDVYLTVQGSRCSLAVLLEGRVEAQQVAVAGIAGLEHREAAARVVAAERVVAHVQSGIAESAEPRGSCVCARKQLLVERRPEGEDPVVAVGSLDV